MGELEQLGWFDRKVLSYSSSFFFFYSRLQKARGGMKTENSGHLLILMPPKYVAMESETLTDQGPVGCWEYDVELKKRKPLGVGNQSQRARCILSSTAFTMPF